MVMMSLELTTVSILIYVVYVGGILKNIAGGSALVLGILSFFRVGIAALENDNRREDNLVSFWSWRWTAMWVIVILISIPALLIPDMTTALAIAGVEVGNEVLQSEYVQDMLEEYEVE